MTRFPTKRWAILACALAVAFALHVPSASGDRNKPAAPKPEQKVDAFGDPLPDGALARMGTVRWRHGGLVTFVGHAAKGKHLVTASSDGFFRVWEVKSGKEIRRFGKEKEGKGDPVGVAAFLGRGLGLSVALSPDGTKLATQNSAGQLEVWNVETGKQIPFTDKPEQPVKGGRISTVRGLVFSPDSKILASLGADQALQLINIAKKETRVIPAGDVKPFTRLGGVRAFPVVFLAGGKTIAKVGIEQDDQKRVSVIRILDVESGKELHQIKNEAGALVAGLLAGTPDGNMLAWGGREGIVLYDTDAGKEIRRIGPKDPRNAQKMLAISPDGKIIATRGAVSGTIQLWDVEEGKDLGKIGDAAPERQTAARSLFGLVGGGDTFAFSPDSRTLAEATPHNSVRFWNVQGGKEIPADADGHHGGVSKMALAADGKSVTTLAPDRTMRRWNVADGRQTAKFELPAETVMAAMSADGKLAAILTSKDTLRVLDVAADKELCSVSLNPGGRAAFLGVALAFSPDGKTLALRGLGDTIRLFQTADGKELPALAGLGKTDPNPANVIVLGGVGAPNPMAFHPHSTALASVTMPEVGGPFGPRGGAAGGNTLLFWNFPGKRSRQFESSAPPIVAMAYAADGRTIAGLRGDNTVTLWEILTGKECGQVKLKETELPPELAIVPGLGTLTTSTTIALSPDGRTVAIGGRTIDLWDLRTGAELGNFKGHEGSVVSLAFAADNKTLLSGGADGTVLVWDGGRYIKHAKAPVVAWTDKDREGLWKDLAGEPTAAMKAMTALDDQPRQAIAVLQDRLKPAAGVEAKVIEQLVADLDSENYPARKKATEDLEKLAELAQPYLEKALEKKPALETQRRVEKLLDKVLTNDAPPAEGRQVLRAIQVLEKNGSPQAQELLRLLAGGAPGHRWTRQADAALKRVTQ